MSNTHYETDLADSIRYASKIQSAILPEKNYFFKIIPESFVLYQPKDVVSGDFYWLSSRKNRIVVVAADCTGHGVPGAFMSIMGINFLNQVTSSVVHPSNQILNHLREYVMKALRQRGDSEDQKDGMDIACCVFDMDNKKLEFSGANNPLIYFRDGVMHQVKGDRMPIGVSPVEEESFNKSVLDFEQVDTLYIFSDGYADQFGGSDNKKMKLKGFHRILNEIQQKPFSEHEELLLQYFNTWKGSEEQVDDVLIIGVNLKKWLYEARSI